MKKAFFILAMAAVLAAAIPALAVPNLVGTWEGPVTEVKGTGEVDNFPVILVVTGQTGDQFYGNLTAPGSDDAYQVSGRIMSSLEVLMVMVKTAPATGSVVHFKGKFLSSPPRIQGTFLSIWEAGPSSSTGKVTFRKQP